MWVHTAQGDWVVPPNRAVWVPAGVEHGIEMTGKVLVQTLYLAAGISGDLPAHCCAVNVSPLLRELILHTVKLGMLDQNVPSRARLIGFLMDQLSVLPAIPLQLPLPSDERAKRAVAWMRAHPDDPGLIKSVARRVGHSARTLERLFQKETGMTFGRWRQQLRLLQACAFWRPTDRSPPSHSKSAMTARARSSRCSSARWEPLRIAISRHRPRSRNVPG